ncbi:MAG TPA: dTDP-4-dehydrorhamnose 3,5-epimerase family protein [Streptosporangiaceae bacterium]|nr:dTDP-4-dehydrorhamnose 3,5-epimerase family protein [Streptosporangiaceae bacterium]
MLAHSGLLIEGTRLITPDFHEDGRGFFANVWNDDVVPGAPDFSRHCVARSRRGVIRGLHVRRPPGEAKLVRCSRGAVYDAVVDLRPASASFMAVAVFELDADALMSLYVPAGCAHGYQAVTDQAEVTYRIDGRYMLSDGDVTVAWDDPELGIAWPLAPPVLSAKDEHGLSAAEAVKLL